jgi:hypothetical protein
MTNITVSSELSSNLLVNYSLLDNKYYKDLLNVDYKLYMVKTKLNRYKSSLEHIELNIIDLASIHWTRFIEGLYYIFNDDVYNGILKLYRNNSNKLFITSVVNKESLLEYVNSINSYEKIIEFIDTYIYRFKEILNLYDFFDKLKNPYRVKEIKELIQYISAARYNIINLIEYILKKYT